MTKFPYTEMHAAIVDGKRWYDCGNGVKFPSITTVLGHTMEAEKRQAIESWRKSLGTVEADRKTKEAADRGTNVHLMIEQLLRGWEINAPKATETDQRMFRSLRFELAKINEVWGLEIPLYSSDLMVAGRTDCIGVFADKPSIIDFKTSTRIKTEHDIGDYWLQCAFYAIAHNELYGTNISQGVIIMASEKGLPSTWKKDLLPYIEPLYQRVASFYEALMRSGN